VKNGAKPALVDADATSGEVAVPKAAKPVDTTAAGDAFNAGYLAARLRGRAPAEAAREGHVLAAQVIRHRGAIVPRAKQKPGKRKRGR
jgi:2-dehydro-3-deoxygluconokinase